MSFFSLKTRTAANCASKSASCATRSAGRDLREARDNARDAAYDLQKELARSACKTENRARKFANDVYGEIENTADHISSQIRSNPLRSLVILLSAGFMLGALAKNIRD